MTDAETGPINVEPAEVIRAADRSLSGGLFGYIDRMRQTHGATVTDGGTTGVCRCGEVGCNAGLFLLHIDKLKASYEMKVQDLAAETLRNDVLQAQVESLREVEQAARDLAGCGTGGMAHGTTLYALIVKLREVLEQQR